MKIIAMMLLVLNFSTAIIKWMFRFFKFTGLWMLIAAGAVVSLVKAYAPCSEEIKLLVGFSVYAIALLYIIPAIVRSVIRLVKKDPQWTYRKWLLGRKNQKYSEPNTEDELVNLNRSIDHFLTLERKKGHLSKAKFEADQLHDTFGGDGFYTVVPDNQKTREAVRQANEDLNHSKRPGFETDR